jgi:hypothetical protein
MLIYNLYADMVFDALSYTDMLLTDLGLECHRKSGAISEIFSSYGPYDYRGLTHEWMAKQSGGDPHVN